MESFQSSLKPGRFFQACSSAQGDALLGEKFYGFRVVSWNEPRVSTSTPSTSKMMTEGKGFMGSREAGDEDLSDG